MGSLGLPEIAFILVLALLIFGPKKLPEIGRTLGKGMAEFRRATDELKRSINTELTLDESPTPPELRTRRLSDPVEGPHESLPPPPPHQVTAVTAVTAPPGEAPPLTEPRSMAMPAPAAPVASPAVTTAPALSDPDLPEPR